MIIRDRGGLLKMHPLPASPRSLFFPRGIFFEKQIGLVLEQAYEFIDIGCLLSPFGRWNAYQNSHKSV